MSRLRSAKNCLGVFSTFAMLIMIAGVVPAGVADISGDIFTIIAENANGTASGSASVDDGSWLYPNGNSGSGEGGMQGNPQNGVLVWALTEPMEFVDGGGETIAILEYATVEIAEDPQINLSFAVQSGPLVTEFRISSGKPEFNIPDAYAQASAAFSVSDFLGDGAMLTGTGEGPLGNAYLAQYNGMVPTGATFADKIDQIYVAPGQGSGGDSFEEPGSGGWSLLPAAAVDMSAEFKFSLSSWDVASGSSTYTIVPEPSSLLLLVAGLTLLRRRD